MLRRGTTLLRIALTVTAVGLATGGITAIQSLTTSTPADAAARQISFKHDVEAIFSAHCAACHIAMSTPMGGLHLSSYQGLIKGGNVLNGSVIVPKKHAKSYLWQIVQPKGPWPGGNRMPLGGPYLSTKDVTTIATWIDQ